MRFIHSSENLKIGINSLQTGINDVIDVFGYQLLFSGDVMVWIIFEDYY